MELHVKRSQGKLIIKKVKPVSSDHFGWSDKLHFGSLEVECIHSHFKKNKILKIKIHYENGVETIVG